MGKLILIASGKGGTGKTTATAAISSCLAAQGFKTLCLDCDAGLRNLDLALGLTDLALRDFADVACGRSSLDDAVIAHPKLENLYFLAAPSGGEESAVTNEAMLALKEEIKEKFDFCLVDAPAGIGVGFRLAALGCDSAILVVTGDASSLRDGQRALIELTRMGFEDVRLIVNRLSRYIARRTNTTVDDMIDAVGAQLIGIVSEDKDVSAALNLETPLTVYGAKYAYPQFERIARRVAGESVSLSKIPEDI